MSSCGERTRMVVFCKYGTMQCDDNGCDFASCWFWTIWAVILAAAIACFIAGAVITDETHSFDKTGWQATCSVNNCVELGVKLRRYELMYNVSGQVAHQSLFDRTSQPCSATKSCFVRLNSDNKLEIHWTARSYGLGLGLLIPACIWLGLHILWLIVSCVPRCRADIDRAETALHASLLQRRGYVKAPADVPKSAVGSPTAV